MPTFSRYTLVAMLALACVTSPMLVVSSPTLPDKAQTLWQRFETSLEAHETIFSDLDPDDTDWKGLLHELGGFSAIDSGKLLKIIKGVLVGEETRRGNTASIEFEGAQECDCSSSASPEEASNPRAYNLESKKVSGHYVKDFSAQKPPPTHLPHWTPLHQYVADQADRCQHCPRLDKWEPYFAAYHEHFKQFRGKQVTMMEVGVQSGGSILMWRWYFGPGLRYYGIDVNPACKQFENEWATIILGDQGDPSFWKNTLASLPTLDIFLDDGGHVMRQQRQTFFSVLPALKPYSVYVCEDLGTSYMSSFGFGGAPAENLNDASGPAGSMVELTKQWIDWLNAYFIEGTVFQTKYSPRLKQHYVLPEEKDAKAAGMPPIAASFADRVSSMHYYSQMVVLELAPGGRPLLTRMGNRCIDLAPHRAAVMYPIDVEEMLSDSMDDRAAYSEESVRATAAFMVRYRKERGENIVDPPYNTTCET